MKKHDMPPVKLEYAPTPGDRESRNPRIGCREERK